MKKETLEEASERIYPSDGYFDEIYCDIGDYDRGKWIEGAKWNQEISYSEEEVLDILVKAIKDVKVKRLTFYDGGSEYPIYSNLSKWFEKYKKKIIMETLEEVAERLYPEDIMWGMDTNEDVRNSFIIGYKLALERMYSEEEVLDLLFNYGYDLLDNERPVTGNTTEEWFEQFKKKSV